MNICHGHLYYNCNRSPVKEVVAFEVSMVMPWICPLELTRSLMSGCSANICKGALTEATDSVLSTDQREERKRERCLEVWCIDHSSCHDIS